MNIIVLNPPSQIRGVGGEREEGGGRELKKGGRREERGRVGEREEGEGERERHTPLAVSALWLTKSRIRGPGTVPNSSLHACTHNIHCTCTYVVEGSSLMLFWECCFANMCLPNLRGISLRRQT